MRVEVNLQQAGDFSAHLAQESFAKAPKPMPTTPALWLARRRPFSFGDIEVRQSKLGEFCWPATVSRPDISACLALLAVRADSPQGSGIYRINVPVKLRRSANRRHL